jgi:DNA repair exonuclease SbcCD ATPase subunit/DNA repair exonuclease SbcCD nuclease subunit
MIKNIYHLADIHITNNESRHEEYAQVFANLYKILEQDPEPKLIVIAGDLFHEKNSHQNKQNILAKQFINKLSTYAEIVIIDGNHDYVPVNDNSSSSIDSLLRYLQVVKPVHYLTENKIYKICGINFGLTTMTSTETTKPNKQNKVLGEIYIGLYHGTLYKSTTNLGWTNDNESNFKVKDFADYDITMLGDIHQFQFLNKSKTIGYPSSLIQQNFGESIDSHGLIKWNLSTKTGEFIPVANKWVYKVFKILDVKNYDIPDIENKNVRLKLIYSGCKREDIDNYKKQIQKKYSIVTIRQEEQYDLKQNISSNTKVNTKGLINVYDTYILEHKLKSDLDVRKKLIEFNELLGLDNLSTVKNLKLKMLEFSNLFAYGSNNKINFDSLQGINIIIGANGLGKSSIVDIILFTLFKKFSRGTGNDALNIRYDKGYAKLSVDLNGEIYQIIRTLNLNKEDVKIIKNNVDITASSKIETDSLIKKIFGNYEDMIMTSIILQVGQNFIDLAETERQNTLTKVLRLEMYDQILSLVKSEISNLSKNILVKYEKSITKINYVEKILELSQDVSEYNEYLVGVEEELKSLIVEELTIANGLNKNILNLNKNELLNEIVNLENQIVIKTNEISNYKVNSNCDLGLEKENIKTMTDISNEKIKSLLKKIKLIKKPSFSEDNIKKLNLQIEKFYESKSQIENVIKQIVSVCSIDKIDIQEIKKTIGTLNNHLAKIKNNIQERNKKIDILNIIKSSNKNLLEHKFNLNCESCTHNKSIHDSQGYLLKITNLELEIDSIVIEDETEIKVQLENLVKLVDKINELQLVKSSIELSENKVNAELLNKESLKEYELISANNLAYEQEISAEEKLVKELNLQYSNLINYEKILTQQTILKNKLAGKKCLLEEYLNYKEEIIRYNEILEEKIEITRRINEYKKKLFELNNLLTLTTKEQTEQQELTKEYETYTKKYDVLNKIKNLFVSGFKEYAFKNRTEILESRINNITRNLANYEIRIHIDNGIIKFYKLIKPQDVVVKTKTKLKNQLDMSDGNLYLNISECSGFERTAFNIGLRLALNSMNITNKNNFIIIDEHFSSADNNNINNIIYLFDTIKTQYEICIIISHLNEIKNINENKIEIERDANTGTSKILYL